MRKFIVGLAGASLLAFVSPANAAVTVSSSTGLTVPNPVSSVATTPDGVTTIQFGQNNLVAGSFTGAFVFNNPAAGTYYIFMGSSTPGLLFTDVTVTGGGTTYTLAPPAKQELRLDGISLLANTDYLLSIKGTTKYGAAIIGNITIMPAAVPEPATWAMMLVGFGAIGFSMRRRRAAALPQLA